jgi:hypothetical protein
MTSKLKTKTNITAYVEIAPNIFANVDGKAVLEWEFEVQERSNYIDGVYLLVPDQTVEMEAQGAEIHPETGDEINLNGRIFKVELSDVEVDNDGIKLKSVVEPIEILKYKNLSPRVEFSSKASGE